MKKFKTILIGFGNIADGYIENELLSKAYSYIAHSQVLSEHPSFYWDAVVDKDEKKLERAKNKWNIDKCYNSIDAVENIAEYEIAVIATPPHERLEIIKKIPCLKGLLIEKPLSINESESKLLLDYCDKNNILVQVNFWRRSDKYFCELAKGELQDLIGEPQLAFAVYGGGLLNNGIHIIDFASMLLGKIKLVQCNGKRKITSNVRDAYSEDYFFSMTTDNDIVINVSPIDYQYYRENSIDILGTKGRIEILVEGLYIRYTLSYFHRGDSHSMELSPDSFKLKEPTVGNALWYMYTDLSNAINEGKALCSSGDSALKSENIINFIIKSYENNGICYKTNS